MERKDQIREAVRGAKNWNAWRRRQRGLRPDLHGADLSGIDFCDANFSDADLTGAIFQGCNLRNANFDGAIAANADFQSADLTCANAAGAIFMNADLSSAILDRTILIGCDFREAELDGTFLRGAKCSGSSFFSANLSRAFVQESDLTQINLVRANVDGASFLHCNIFGIAAWDLKGEPAKQYDLVITASNESPILIDSLEVAQFLYLLLYNKSITKVVDSVATRVVLLLGRFTHDRKAVLDKLREELRRRGKIPVIFDFDPSPKRNLTETVSTLAHLAQFIIADISDPRSVPHELSTIVPTLPSVPVQPIRARDSDSYSMFEDLQKSYKWVLEPFIYRNTTELIAAVDSFVIKPAERYILEVRPNKTRVEPGP